jgi:hypothetical protein
VSQQKSPSPINGLIALSDARTVSWQSNTWVEFAERATRYARDPSYVREGLGAEYVFSAVDGGGLGRAGPRISAEHNVGAGAPRRDDGAEVTR